MNIALIQHRIRGEMSADAAALGSSVRDACERGASVVVCPVVPSLVAQSEASRDTVLSGLEGCAEGTALLLPFRDSVSAEITLRPTPLGTTALLVADECLLPTTAASLLESRPDAIVMRPLALSELQSEAVLERAIGLSLSVAGLVIVSECSGGNFAEPGHGGSAIIALGQVVAEATDDDEVLMVDIDAPVSAPEPREPLPTLPLILEQRLAHHQGRKAEVGYLADLS